ncbi:MAG TPA: glycosyltransferase [Hyphomicrobiaceae bacterium]|nr:glycosyltransferase [Hyphomicrobiaceae bacterium]
MMDVKVETSICPLLDGNDRIAASVIVCTHNPRQDYFCRTIDALRSQSLPAEGWEFLVVDNCSVPPVAVDLTWHPHACLLRETTIGLTNARICGIEQASADLLIFVDDDNVLAPDYLERTLEIARDWPILGTWGGQIVPEFEISPPAWTRPYWKALSLREVRQDLWSNLPGAADSEPFGAGMCVRRRVAFYYREVLRKDIRRSLLGRKGHKLTSGEDSDLAWAACDLGLGNGVFARLKLTHLIPQMRLEERYLLRLVEGLSFSKVMLDSIHGVAPSQPSRSQRLYDFYRHLRLSARERRFIAAKARGRTAALAKIKAHTR